MTTNIAQSAPAPVVTLSHNRAVTTSKDVADCFGKNHRDVLRTIENLFADLPVDHQRNFAQTVIERPNPSGGAPIKSPAYEITRDGFTLLAMGFTGKKALRFKLAYIDAFNQMEAKLRGIAPDSAARILNSTIGTDGFHVLGALVAGKVRALPTHARRRATMKLWAQVHAAFNVRSAEDIPADQLDSARNFIGGYALEGELLEREKKPVTEKGVFNLGNVLKAINEPNGYFVSDEDLFAFVRATINRLERRNEYHRNRAEGKPVKLCWGNGAPVMAGRVEVAG